MDALATVSDVQVRLGRESLTAAESARIEALLTDAQAMILLAVDKPASWLDDQEAADMKVLTALCAQVVVRTMQNPRGARSQSESLGAYSHSESFTDAVTGLSDVEMTLAREAVYGVLVASEPAETMADDVLIYLHGWGS